MKRICLSVLLLLILNLALLAQDTRITFNIKGFESKPLVIEHYGGKANQVFSGNTDPTGFLSVTLKLIERGFYKVIFDKNKGDFFLITGPGDNITITSSMDNLIGAMKVEGSPENARYIAVKARTDSIKVLITLLEQEYQRLNTTPGNETKLAEIVEKHTLLQNERLNIIRNFMAENPGSLAVLFFTEDVKLEHDPVLYDLMIEELEKKHPQNFYVQDLKRKVQVDKVTRTGSVAPDIALPNPGGDTIRLSSLKGKIVLLDFWAAWCGPCRRENPNLVRIYNQYKDKGFEIYGVSLDRDRASWVKGIQDDKLTWVLVSDLKYWSSDAARLYGVTSIPHALLLDREGRIIAKKIRSHELEKILAEIFGE